MMSAASSRTNLPASTLPCPPTSNQIIAAADSRVTIESAWVTTRRRSSRNRSSISNANAPTTTSNSGAIGASSAKERKGGGVIAVVITSCSPRRPRGPPRLQPRTGACSGPGSQLARRDVGRQLGDRRIHQVDQRLGPYTDQQGAERKRAQHD